MPCVLTSELQVCRAVRIRDKDAFHSHRGRRVQPHGRSSPPQQKGELGIVF